MDKLTKRVVAVAASLLAAPLLMLGSNAQATTTTFGPPRTLFTGCTFGDQTTDGNGATRGFYFCGDSNEIRWFVFGGGYGYRVETTPWHGRVLAAAADSTGTYAVIAAEDGLMLAQRAADGRYALKWRYGVASGGLERFGSADLLVVAGQYWAVWSERQAGVYQLHQRHDYRSRTDVIGAQRITLSGVDEVLPRLAIRPGGGILMMWNRARPGMSAELRIGTNVDGRWATRLFSVTVLHQPAEIATTSSAVYIAWIKNGLALYAHNRSGRFAERVMWWASSCQRKVSVAVTGLRAVYASEHCDHNNRSRSVLSAGVEVGYNQFQSHMITPAGHSQRLAGVGSADTGAQLYFHNTELATGRVTGQVRYEPSRRPMI